MYHFSVSCRDNGESWRQQPATCSGYGFSVLEAVCRLRWQNRRPFPPLHHGELLAQPMPQVLLLPGAARRNRNIVLHEKWYDSLQKWLYQVRCKNALVLAGVSRCCMTAPMLFMANNKRNRKVVSVRMQKGRNQIWWLRFGIQCPCQWFPGQV